MTGSWAREAPAATSTAGRTAAVAPQRRVTRQRPAPLDTSPPARVRRRPALVAVGALLVVCGGLSAAWLTISAGGSESVLALAHDVPQGRALVARDLVTVRVSPDRDLRVVPASQRSAVLGRHSTARLLTGSLLTPGSTTTAPIPAAGESVVGVSLTAAQRPAVDLVADDPVRVVSTPATQADPPSKTPDVIEGRVVDVAAPDSAGRTTVDVLVPSLEAAGLAARAATGRVALVLDSRSS